MNLYQASQQWAQRPADERYWNLREMFEATHQHYETAQETTVDLRNLAVVPDQDTSNLLLCGSDAQAVLTHHCFVQVCVKAAAPAEYLRTLPRDLVCRNLNVGITGRQRGMTNRRRLPALHLPFGSVVRVKRRLRL